MFMGTKKYLNIFTSITNITDVKTKYLTKTKNINLNL